jgi:hypothetical protein
VIYVEGYNLSPEHLDSSLLLRLSAKNIKKRTIGMKVLGDAILSEVETETERLEELF